MRELMATPGDEENEIMIPCKLCAPQVWIRKDRLQKHVQKVHSAKAAPKKSFTTYKARIESTFPPKVRTQSINSQRDSVRVSKSQIILTSRSGVRIDSGLCAECGLEQSPLWHYAESNRGAVDICSECKQIVFDRSFG